MKLLTNTTPHQLHADDGKVLYDKLQDEKSRYYFTVAYMPDTMTLADCQAKYDEIEKEEIEPNEHKYD